MNTVKEFLKLHWFFILRYIFVFWVIAFVIFLIHKGVSVTISHDNLGVLLQASLGFGAVFVFMQGIVLWRAGRYKNDEASGKEILADFSKFMPRLVGFLVVILALLLAWSFFNIGENEVAPPSFRYFLFIAIAVIVSAFYYLFKSVLSYLDLQNLAKSSVAKRCVPFEYVFVACPGDTFETRCNTRIGHYDIGYGTKLFKDFLVGGFKLVDLKDKNFAVETKGDTVILRGIHGKQRSLTS